MAQHCLQIVNWLKSWFKPRDEDYQYNITSSDYNPNIDSTVTITVTVTDGNDNPVTNHSFELNANGTLVSRTTDTNGEATYHYTCSDWGIHRFSVNSSSVEINVKGFKQIWANGDNKIRLWQDGSMRLARLTMHGSPQNLSTTWVQYGSIAFMTSVKPLMPVTSLIYDYTGVLRIGDDGKLYMRSISGTLTNKNIYAQIEWTY